MVEETVVIKGETEDLDKKVKKSKKEIDGAKDSASGLTDQIDSMTGGAVSGFKKFAGAVKTTAKGFKTLRGAIVATGLGALIVGITAVVEWFNNFDAAVKLVSQGMDAMGAVINQLGKAFDLLMKGEFSAAADAIKDVGVAAKQAAQNAGELFEVTKQLQELQAKNIPLNAKLRQDLELQKKILEDTTLTEKERLAALEQVTELSSQIQQNAIDENKLKAEELRLKIANENSDKARRELNIELAQTQAELINQEGQLNIIRKDAEKVEREILTLTRQKKNEQLAEELRLQTELKELLKEDKEIDKSEEDLNEADRLFNAEMDKSQAVIINKQNEKEALKKIELDYNETLNQLNEESAKRAEEEIKRQQAVASAKQSINAAVGNSLIALTNLAAEGSNVQKSFAIASIAYDTSRAITSAISNSQSPTPDNIATGGLAGLAKAATIISSILVGVGRAKSVLKSAPSVPRIGGGGSFGGGGGFGGSFGGGGNFFPTDIGAIPSNVPTVNVGNLSDQPIKTYVVEQDISSAQNAQKILERKTIM